MESVALVRRIARRYVAGDRLADALPRAAEIQAAGHRVNVEYMGESCRDAALAVVETQVFLDAATELPAGCSISLDLSHIGLAIDADLALDNAVRVARATADTGREMVISAEGSSRTDAVLAVHGSCASGSSTSASRCRRGCTAPPRTCSGCSTGPAASGS